jgi:hypothetical protein
MSRKLKKENHYEKTPLRKEPILKKHSFKMITRHNKKGNLL